MVRCRHGSRKRNLKCTSTSQLTKVLRISGVICCSRPNTTIRVSTHSFYLCLQRIRALRREQRILVHAGQSQNVDFYRPRDYMQTPTLLVDTATCLHKSALPSLLRACSRACEASAGVFFRQNSGLWCLYSHPTLQVTECSALHAAHAFTAQRPRTFQSAGHLAACRVESENVDDTPPLAASTPTRNSRMHCITHYYIAPHLFRLTPHR